MNTIVIQNCKNFIHKIMNFMSEPNAKKLEELETGLETITFDFILNMMKIYVENLDKEIKADKKWRRKNGIVVERNNDKREIFTKFGVLTYHRTYFYDKKNDTYIYLVDTVLGIDPYDRISTAVAADMVEYSGDNSYAKSSQYTTGGLISRQTVMNKTRKLKEEKLKMEAEGPKRKMQVIHIDADEDHVALQNGKNAIVPLITIYEGTKRIGKRGKCINPYHIHGYGQNPEETWLKVANYIYDRYDIDYLKRIYIHGDGALWIKTGQEWLPKSKMVLDKYHLNKAILKATAGQEQYRKSIYRSIYEGNWIEFCKLVTELKHGVQSPKKRERIHEFRTYIKNNWEAITIYKEEGVSGSCTEGHISHILSSRFSSRPMGWSKKGLKTIADIRIYCQNGGKITPNHFTKVNLQYKIKKETIKKGKEVFSKTTHEKLNNIPAFNMGKKTPISTILKGIQRSGYVI
ncbi:MAG TPA: ISLre2 family transposase [Tepidanaerobacteraceae bacterium]|nr:ISLre2 family transposase [Tepidanaerobacteraceae bacterium]